MPPPRPPVPPGLTPFTETSARSPPLVAGSMVTLCGDGAGGRLFPVLTVGQDLDAVIDQRRQIAVALEDGDLDDAVVHRPTVAVVGEGDRDLTVTLATFGKGWAADCGMAADGEMTARARTAETQKSATFVMARPFRRDLWVNASLARMDSASCENLLGGRIEALPPIERGLCDCGITLLRWARELPGLPAKDRR